MAAFGILFSMCMIFCGLFFVAFRKGRRRMGAIVSAAGVFCFLVFVVIEADSSARENGFAGFSDQQAALKAGVTDASIWETQNPRKPESQKDAINVVQPEAKVEVQYPVVLDPESAAQDLHDKELGFQCLSPWDGSHPAFERAVKARINDPESFEHDETRTWTVNAEGRNTIMMSFRAKNGFGGVILGRAAGSFANAKCDDIRVDFVE